MEVAVLLTHPAPIAPRLLAADDALFEQSDLDAASRQFIRGADANNAAAYYRDVASLREIFAIRDFVDP
jgi:hypothetical protein